LFFIYEDREKSEIVVAAVFWDKTPCSPVHTITALDELITSIFLYVENKTTIFFRNLFTLHGITNALRTSNLVSQSQDRVFSKLAKVFYV
jgi:hypothetical protein